MKKTKNILSKKIQVIAALALAAGLLSLPTNQANAATSDTQANFSLVGGSYELTAPATIDFGSATVSGAAQSLKKPVGIVNVGDLTGSGNGWRLQAQATPYTSGSEVLPNGSLLLKAPLSVSAVSGTSALPTIQTGSPFVLDGGSDVTILTAGLNQGMGSFNVDFSNADALTVNIPGSAKAGNYSSTITWKIVVGP